MTSPVTPPPSLAPPPVATPDWYRDPWQTAAWRWWDGAQWTQYTDGVGTGPVGVGGPRESGVRGGWIAAVAFVLANVASIALATAAYFLTGHEYDVWVALASYIGLWSVMGGGCLLAVHRNHRGGLAVLGLRRLTWRDLGIGAAAGLILWGIVMTVAGWVTTVFDDVESFDNGGSGLDIHAGWFAAIVIITVAVIGAPFFEELFFRGLVLGVLTRRRSVATAIVIQGVLFGIVHYQIGMSFPQIALTVIIISTTGVGLGWLRWHYRRLGPAMIAHGVYNAIVMTLIFTAT